MAPNFTTPAPMVCGKAGTQGQLGFRKSAKKSMAHTILQKCTMALCLSSRILADIYRSKLIWLVPTAQPLLMLFFASCMTNVFSDPRSFGRRPAFLFGTPKEASPKLPSSEFVVQATQGSTLLGDSLGRNGAARSTTADLYSGMEWEKTSYIL